MKTFGWLFVFLFAAAPYFLIGYGFIVAVGSGFFGGGHNVSGALVPLSLGIAWKIANHYTLSHPK